MFSLGRGENEVDPYGSPPSLDAGGSSVLCRRSRSCARSPRCVGAARASFPAGRSRLCVSPCVASLVQLELRGVLRVPQKPVPPRLLCGTGLPLCGPPFPPGVGRCCPLSFSGWGGAGETQLELCLPFGPPLCVRVALWPPLPPIWAVLCPPLFLGARLPCWECCWGPLVLCGPWFCWWAGEAARSARRPPSSQFRVEAGALP